MFQMEELVRSNTSVDLPKCEGEDTIFEFVVGENGQWEHWSGRVSQMLDVVCRSLLHIELIVHVTG